MGECRETGGGSCSHGLVSRTGAIIRIASWWCPGRPGRHTAAGLLAAALLLAPGAVRSQTVPGPDLLVEISNVEAPVIGVGASTKVNFRVTNMGAAAVTAFAVSIDWDAALEIDAGRIAPFRCTDGSCDFEPSTGLYEYTNGGLDTGESTELSLVFFGVTEEEAASIAATYATSTPGQDPGQTAADSSQVDIVVSGTASGPDIEVGLQAPSPDFVAVGEASRLTVRALNFLTDAPLRTFELRFDLDESFSVVPGRFHLLTCPEGTCSFDRSRRVFRYDGTLGARQFVSFTIEVQGAVPVARAEARVVASLIQPPEGPGAVKVNTALQRIDVVAALDPGDDPPTAYYIDADAGSDANPGTQAEPFATLQRCVDTWNERGDAVIEHVSCRGRGVFHEEIVIRGGGPSRLARNQLIPWDTDGDGDLADETFVLDGENARNIAIKADQGASPRNVEITGLTIRNYWPDGDWRCDPDAPRPPDERLSFFDLRSNKGTDDWWIHHNTLTDLAPGCSYPTANSQFMMVRPTNANNLLFEDNLVERIHASYLFRYFSGWGVRIRRNVFRDFQQGPKIWGAGAYGVRDIEIADNTFDCADWTFSVGGFSNDVRDGAIRRNHYRNCRNGVSIGTGNGGTEDSYAQVIEDNVFEIPDRPFTNGVNFSDCAAQSTSSGEDLELRDVVIRNNVFTGPGQASSTRGIFIRSGHLHPFHNDVRIVGNTFRGLELGVQVGACVEAEDSGLPVLHEIHGLELSRNLFEDVREFYDIRTPDLPADFTSDHNVVGPAARVTWTEGGTVRSGRPFSEWLAETEFDQSSAICAALFAGPSDWHLDPADTCAVDAAPVHPDLGRDHDGDGRPYGPGVDIGADEVPIGDPPPSTSTTTTSSTMPPGPTTTSTSTTTTLAGGGPSAADRACILAMNVRTRALVSAAARTAVRCTRRAVRGEDLSDCLSEPSRRMERAEERAADDAQRYCSESTPAFGYGGLAVLVSTGRSHAVQAMTSLFGPDPESALAPQPDDRDRPRCQASLLKAMDKEARRTLRRFVKCKKAVLGGESPVDAAALVDCLTGALREEGRRAPGRVLRRQVAGICAAVDPSTALPGPCGVSASLEDCLVTRLQCDVCRTVSAADALAFDCAAEFGSGAASCN